MKTTIPLLMRVLAIVLALALGSPTQLCAQGSFRREDRRALGRGVYRGSVAFGSNAGTIDHAFAEVRFSEGGWLAGVTPLAGPLVGDDLLSLAKSVDGRAAMALIAPSEGTGPNFPTGLRIAGGRLVGWPADGRVHLLLRPEGGALLTELQPVAEVPGTVAWDDGTSLTLRSINGQPPTAEGEASVYTGPLEARRGPFVAAGENLLFLVVEPAERNTVIESQFRAEAGLKDWKPVSVQARADLRIGTGQTAVAVTTGGPAAAYIQESLKRRGAMLRIVAPLDRDAALAAAVVPVGTWLIRQGQPVAPEGERQIVHSAIATDESGGRIMLWSPDPERQRGLPIPLAQFAAYLREQGYTNAVALEDSRPLLLPDARARTARDTRIATAYALVARNEPMPVRLGALPGDLYGVRGVVIEGTRRELSGNGPGALKDGRIARDPALGGFWASPMPDDGKPLSLGFVFSRPRPIAAVELIHAGACGFSPALSISDYQVWGRARRDGPWTLLQSVSHQTPQERDRIVLEGTPRLNDLRIDIIRPSFLQAASVARLAEVIFYSPEPEIEPKD